jgi:hypothetical protein
MHFRREIAGDMSIDRSTIGRDAGLAAANV